MKSELINQLKRNTRFLEQKAKKKSDMLDRFEIIEQIYLNLKVLKEEMNKEDYIGEFKDLETKVISIINNLSDKSFLQEILDKVNSLVKIGV